MHEAHVFRVMVVDDDFMIARLHARFINNQSSYQVIHTAVTGTDALAMLATTKPDLIVLDVYLPDLSGIEVLSIIRSRKIPCDVILITAAQEREVVEEGFRLGVFDYLVKPFDLKRLGESLHKFTEYKQRLVTSASVDQLTVDSLKRIRSTTSTDRTHIESGIDPRTLQRIRNCLQQAYTACTAEDIAREAGVSRSTARYYLDYLVEIHDAQEELSYGAVGRPKRLFRFGERP